LEEIMFVNNLQGEFGGEFITSYPLSVLNTGGPTQSVGVYNYTSHDANGAPQYQNGDYGLRWNNSTSKWQIINDDEGGEVASTAYGLQTKARPIYGSSQFWSPPGPHIEYTAGLSDSGPFVKMVAITESVIGTLVMGGEWLGEERLEGQTLPAGTEICGNIQEVLLDSGIVQVFRGHTQGVQ
jgi:hypothetical protein